MIIPLVEALKSWTLVSSTQADSMRESWSGSQAEEEGRRSSSPSGFPAPAWGSLSQRQESRRAWGSNKLSSSDQSFSKLSTTSCFLIRPGGCWQFTTLIPSVLFWILRCDLQNVTATHNISTMPGLLVYLAMLIISSNTSEKSKGRKKNIFIMLYDLNLVKVQNDKLKHPQTNTGSHWRMAVLKDSRMAVALNPDARVLHLHCFAVPVLEQYQLRGLLEITKPKSFLNGIFGRELNYLKYQAALAHPSLRLWAALGLAGHNEPLALPSIARALWWIERYFQSRTGWAKEAGGKGRNALGSSVACTANLQWNTALNNRGFDKLIFVCPNMYL